jgi:hypothetical protein
MLKGKARNAKFLSPQSCMGYVIIIPGKKKAFCGLNRAEANLHRAAAAIILKIYRHI